MVKEDNLKLYAFAEAVSSTELINNAKQYDGKTVTYIGEVIGDIMIRGEYAWINVNDGKNAIGIWIDKELAQGISYTGSYKSKGDWIEVTGIFHRACQEHGGDLDIHAQDMRKLSQGRKIKEGINPVNKVLFFTLSGILVVIWISKLLKRK
jgi:hypothetical protein